MIFNEEPVLHDYEILLAVLFFLFFFSLVCSLTRFSCSFFCCVMKYLTTLCLVTFLSVLVLPVLLPFFLTFVLFLIRISLLLHTAVPTRAGVFSLRTLLLSSEFLIRNLDLASGSLFSSPLSFCSLFLF